MLQGPGMHAVSIRNNEIHECKPWKRYLARTLWEKILPKYLIWKLASRENKKKNSTNKQKPWGRSEQVVLHEAQHGRCCAESSELSGVITHTLGCSLCCRQSQPARCNYRALRWLCLAAGGCRDGLCPCSRACLARRHGSTSQMPGGAG